MKKRENNSVVSEIGEFVKKHNIKITDIVYDSEIKVCTECGGKVQDMDAENEDGSPVCASAIFCPKCKIILGLRLKLPKEMQGADKRTLVRLIKNAKNTFRNALLKLKRRK